MQVKRHVLSSAEDHCSYSFVSLKSAYKLITKETVFPLRSAFSSNQGIRLDQHLKMWVVSSKPESFGYQRPMLMVPFRLFKIHLTYLSAFEFWSA
ncbi:hypothetical protein Tco_0966365 [Tanacetum coccineum]